jgi:hypothetical protein
MEEKAKDTTRSLSDNEKWLYSKILALEGRVYDLEHGYKAR